MPNFLDRPAVEFRRRPLLFLDFELTGLDPKIHEITEIAALLVSQPDFRIVNSFYTKVLPVHVQTADPDSLRVSGYDPKLWSDAISLHQALGELSSFAPDCTLVGWAVQTEWDFLNAALEQENLPYFYDHRLIEVYTLAYRYFSPLNSVKNLNLSSAARHFGIFLDNHKPDSDIRVTYEIFKRLII